MAIDVTTGDPFGVIGPGPSRPEEHVPRRIGWRLVADALRDSFVKLDPRLQARNPVMFVVEIGAVIVTLIGSMGLVGRGDDDTSYALSIAAWLWVTVLFANAAEALAEGRGKAQAAALRRTRAATVARVMVDGARDRLEVRASSDLRPGDVVIVEAGETIPGDGEVIEGVAFVSEAAITGESAPVLKEPGTDISSSVTGGTTVVSDHLIIRISSEPGQSFLDRMIALVEGAVRQKSPNEIALDILLAGLTIIFLIVVVTLTPLSIYAGARASTVVSVALLVTLIPTTIGGLLSAIGIAGMDRLMQQNVLAMSGRAVEAAGDVDVLLLDKTGTITFGNRMASDFLPLDGVEVSGMAEAALLASIADTTPEGKSIVLLARQFGANAGDPSDEAEFIPFSAETRMSGIDIGGRRILKGAVDAVAQSTGMSSGQLRALVNHVAARGGTPLALVDDGQPLGVIALDDTVKPGIRERFDELRNMGIRTVMVTGDNPLTAATIAAQAGVDDFVAEARPEDKIDLIRRYQAEGRMVAMTGDGTNDAPALAQADVGVAMNTGTAAAKEAGNMVDLDSDPAKLVAIVGIGKQMLMTRGALTTFSIANDVAKYFAIIPALFVLAYPQSGATNLLSPVDVMHLHSPESAILSAIIFNALIIVLLIPLALRGVPYRPMPAAQLLRRNLLVFGVGGLIAPFIGIKTIDFILASTGLV